jgi:DnaJ-class molecular chaperone
MGFDFSMPNEAPGVCCKCRGTGRYVVGPIINGKGKDLGTCYSCRGTGRQDRKQIARNECYNRHKIITL